MNRRTLYSYITPSRGDRPKALENALASVEAAVAHAGLVFGEVEVLVGFDGVKGPRVPAPEYVRFFDFPYDGDFGNAIRHGLLKAARGRWVLFLDDDNAVTENSLSIFRAYPEAELIIARIDTSRAHDVPFLPRENDGEVMRQTNVDPLCLCATRDLVVDRCGGWTSQGGYEADFVNMRKYYRRAKSVQVLSDVVGIYDAGAEMDSGGNNFRRG